MSTAALRVQRVDRYSLRLDASSVSAPPNMPGVVDVWGVATRVGVFLYGPEDIPELNPGEILREYRPPEEVLAEASLSSLVGVPFTVDHPSDNVTAETWRDLAHGNVLEVQPDGGTVRVRVRIASTDALAQIKRGKVELSCGYSARLEDASGVTPDGEVYDVVQRDIRYNHLALVDLARAGHIARLKFDGKTARVQRRDSRTGPRPMKFTIKFDGKTYPVSPLLVPGLSAESDATKQRVRRGDQIETAEVMFSDPDGGEAVQLILPKGTVEEMLAMIGAGGAPAPAAPMDPPDDEMGLEDPPVGEMPLEEDEAPVDGEGKPKMDAAVRALVATLVADGLKTAIPKAIQAREDRARERADLERRVAPVLSESYRFDEATDVEISADAIEAACPARADEAKGLAAKAAAGDLRALGRLDGLLDVALEGAREDRGDSGEALGAVFRLRDASSSEVVEGGETPRHEKLRQARIDRMNRGVSKDSA